MGRKARSARSQGKLDEDSSKRVLVQNHTSPLLNRTPVELEDAYSNGGVEQTKIKRLYRPKDSLMT